MFWTSAQMRWNIWRHPYKYFKLHRCQNNQWNKALTAILWRHICTMSNKQRFAGGPTSRETSPVSSSSSSTPSPPYPPSPPSNPPSMSSHVLPEPSHEVHPIFCMFLLLLNMLCRAPIISLGCQKIQPTNCWLMHVLQSIFFKANIAKPGSAVQLC